MSSQKNVYLICNAHLDPVWLWEWPEGAGEALSTFRIAAELCEKYDTFIFNHNEAVLYEWVRQYEPELFKRIQKLVKAGRWNIMGGWYLQPDCNMPSGEAFVRQVSLGKRYFREQFGVDVKTAINFDPFGHTRGLVQIMTKTGYDSYLFGRPRREDIELPGMNFVWVGFDGSEIMATRFPGWYNSWRGQAAQVIAERIEDFDEEDTYMVLWGVGNHGGGPSKKDLAEVNKLLKNYKGAKVEHSTPQDYFKYVKKKYDELGRWDKGLNPWAVGCYTSMIRVKQKYRRLENAIFSAEKMCCQAWLNGLMDYPGAELEQMQKDMASAQFHDALPGSGIPPVEEGVLRELDHGNQIGEKLKTKAFFALCSGQPKAKEGTVPILVHNPHPFDVEQAVDCEFSTPEFGPFPYRDVKVLSGKKQLTSQVEQEMSSLAVDWRKHIVFNARLKPGMNRFDCLLEETAEPKIKLKARNGKINFKGEKLNVVINTRTGLVDRLAVSGKNFVKPAAFAPLAIADSADSWEGRHRSFPKVAGKFKLMNKTKGSWFSGVQNGTIDSVRVIEDGPVRSIVEAVFEYNQSFICQRYIMSKTTEEFAVQCRVFWNEKDTMLKLEIPSALKQAEFTGQVAYGRERLFEDGTESVAQKWVAIDSKKDKLALAVINNGTYGSDFKDGRVRLTLLRSPAYSSGAFEITSQGLPQDRFSPRIDQGERLFEFWLKPGSRTSVLNGIDRVALTKNEQPEALSFFPPGTGKKAKPLAELSDKTVELTAAKMSDKGRDLVVRLFEPTGRRRTTKLKLPAIGKTINIELGPFEIKTIRINPRTKKYKFTDLLES